MGDDMSVFTQFVGGNSAGSIVPGNTLAWGVNITINGVEYLRTGTLKTYTSSNAAFASAVPSATWIEPTASDAGWVVTAYSGGMLMFYLNSNYHMLEYQVTSAIRGTSFASAPGSVAINNNPYDAMLFNNYIIVAADNGSSGVIRYSDGSNATYTSATSAYFASLAYFSFTAASGSLAVVAASNFNNDGYLTGKIQTSTNGTSWTSRTPSSNVYDTTVRRFFWSPVANAFFMITSTGAIYTTTDGYTFTARTAPSGMPATISENNYMFSGLGASSSTSTLVSLGNSKLLKITGLTSYSIIDISSLIGNTNSAVRMLHDGTKYYMSYYSAQGNLFTSTDEGTTWVGLPSLYNSTYVTSNQFVNGLAYVNSRLIEMVAYRPFDITTQVASGVPNKIGTLSTSYFDPGYNTISAYWQVT
jgi:hypothetical protein